MKAVLLRRIGRSRRYFHTFPTIIRIYVRDETSKRTLDYLYDIGFVKNVWDFMINRTDTQARKIGKY